MDFSNCLQTLEIQKHRSGFAPKVLGQPGSIIGVEPYTVHARTRYRLLSSTAKDGPDSNLWLVLYRRADPKYMLSVNNTVVQQIASQQWAILDERNKLFDPSRGSKYSVYDRGLDIKQKGFVWASDEQWPTIKAPRAPENPQPSGYNHIARGGQGMYAAGQQLTNARAGPPSKSRRGNAGQRIERPQPPEGEDDEGRDIMDVLTPREISLTRYRQHTEWMEELFISPYPIHKLRPVSLGLGRTGALSGISNGADFADAPMSVEHESEVQKPSAAQYDAYIKQAEDKIAEMKADMVKEKALHEKRMAKIRQSGALQEAERKLRSAVQFPPHASSKANEAIHAGGKDVDVAMLRQIDDVQNIAQEVEASLGRKIVLVEQAKCIDRGGFEEKAPSPPAQQDVAMEGADELASNGPGQPALAATMTNNGVAGNALQAQPDPSLALADDDFEMVDKDDLLGDLTMDAVSGPPLMQGSGVSAPGDTTVLGIEAPGDDFGDQFLNLPDDSIGGTPGDDFGTSAFDDAFGNAGTADGDNGGNNSIDQMAQQE